MNDKPAVAAESTRFQEACDWFVRLREAPECEELIAEWLSWCKQDAQNRRAFEEVRQTWLVMGLMPVRGGTGEGLRPRNIAAIRTATRDRPVRRWQRPAAVAAITVAVVTGLSWLLLANLLSAARSDVSLITTAPTEHRSFALADGSRVEMSGASKLRVRFGGHARDIELGEGEAYFSVAHDEARPFIVHAGSLGVRAVGTRFDVRTAGDRVVVAVEEGVVVVESPSEPIGPISAVLSRIRGLEGEASPSSPLHPLHVRRGQEVAVGGAEHDLQLLPIEPTQVASWREGRLHFSREPLRSVISSIRAVSGRDIELADADLGEQRFTGTVFSSGIEAWLQALPAVFPVTVHQDGARFIIRRRIEARN